MREKMEDDFFVKIFNLLTTEFTIMLVVSTSSYIIIL